MKFNEIKDIESPLLELNMGPKNIASEVNKVLKHATPMVGIEIEVCLPCENSDDAREKIGEQLITSRFNRIDFETIFEENNNLDDVRDEFNDWQAETRVIWCNREIQKVIYDVGDSSVDTEKKYIMQDYDATQNRNVVKALKSLGRDPEDHIDEKFAHEILMGAEEYSINHGKFWFNLDNETEDGQVDLFDDPYAILYKEILIKPYEAGDLDEQGLLEYYENDFYYHESDDEDYSIGSFFLSKNLATVEDVAIEYGYYLYSDYDEDDEDRNAVAQKISDMSENNGYDVGCIGEYHSCRRDYTTWIIENDPSIKPGSDYSFEIISPVIEYQEVKDTIETVFKELSDMGAYTNKSTGLHINVSIDGINHNDVDYVKLILFLGDRYVGQTFDREFNEFAQSSLKQFAKNVDNATPYTVINIYNRLKNNVNAAIGNGFNLNFGKYTSVGLKNNRIEFRSPGGKDYIENISTILNIINRFVMVYAIAADPDAHKNEYSKKLYKLLSTANKSIQTPELFVKYAAGIIDSTSLIQELKRKQQVKAEDKTTSYETYAKYLQKRQTEITDIPTLVQIIKNGVENTMKRTGIKDKEHVLQTVVEKLQNNLHFYD